MPNNKIASEIDRIIGENVCRMRKEAGLNQRSLGMALFPPVKYQQISKFEQGYNRISAAQLVEMSDMLGCAPEDLLEGTLGPWVPKEEVTPQDAEMRRHYAQLPTPLKMAVLGLVKLINQ